MTNWLVSSITVLVHVACQIFFTRSQTITVNPVGVWTEGSSVTLNCTISSYSGEMKWKLGSTDVAKCSLITCSTLATGEGAYLFGFDTTNRIFTWTLNPVKETNNGDVFYCSNGTNTANFTATVQEQSTEHTIEYKLSVYSTVGSSLTILSVIALIIGVVYIHKRHRAQKAEMLLLRRNIDGVLKKNKENQIGMEILKETYQDDKVQEIGEDSNHGPITKGRRPLPEIVRK